MNLVGTEKYSIGHSNMDIAARIVFDFAQGKAAFILKSVWP